MGRDGISVFHDASWRRNRSAALVACRSSSRRYGSGHRVVYRLCLRLLDANLSQTVGSGRLECTRPIVGEAIDSGSTGRGNLDRDSWSRGLVVGYGPDRAARLEQEGCMCPSDEDALIYGSEMWSVLL